ncbi:Lrp/AsnC family transcriptional regulator [Marinomonas agarivorans]|nr:Lrp/AsnC family transcriptional regulator [Marinomonas agarivorans]
MDDIDRHILKALQEDGRLTNVELADKINLSASPCLRRVKKLEQTGTIVHYRANLEREKVGLAMTVFVDVTLDKHSSQIIDEFEQAIIAMPNIISCFMVSGAGDYRLEIVAKDLKHYEQVLKQVQALPNIKGINSNFAIRAVKSAATLPLPY